MDAGVRQQILQALKDTYAPMRHPDGRLLEGREWPGEGDLERMYDKLKNSYAGCEAQADDVHKRIENMEGVARSMFAEWEKEINQYSNPTLAEKSRSQLQQTQERYAQLSKFVRDSESSMKPVLSQLKDQVLFLKHNLNAAAIGSLKGEATSIQSQIQDLIARMNSSIEEADRFIKTLAQ